MNKLVHIYTFNHDITLQEYYYYYIYTHVYLEFISYFKSKSQNRAGGF